MPLPFAPKPEESRVYDSLKSVLLDDVTADQLESLRETVFAQGVDGAEDEYRRLLLLMLASQAGSISGPIPGASTIEQITRTSDSGLFTIFQPDSGIYQFNGGDILSSGGSGACNFYLYDGSVQTYIGSASTSGQEPLPTDTYGLRTPFFVSPTMYFAGDITSISTSIRITAAFVRVR